MTHPVAAEAPHPTSEREKMLAGQWYDANFDSELIVLRRRVEELCFDFNHARPHSDEQDEVLKKILGHLLPKGLEILAPVYFDYGIYTSFGTGTFVNHGCYFMDGGGITIGMNVFIGPFCGFYTASHPMDYAMRNKGLEKALPIKIGDNSWIGANVSVMPGASIGSGCVIAAGSTVIGEISDNSLAAGVPATVKKHIEMNGANQF